MLANLKVSTPYLNAVCVPVVRFLWRFSFALSSLFDWRIHLFAVVFSICYDFIQFIAPYCLFKTFICLHLIFVTYIFESIQVVRFLIFFFVSCWCCIYLIHFLILIKRFSARTVYFLLLLFLLLWIIIVILSWLTWTRVTLKLHTSTVVENPDNNRYVLTEIC